MSYEQESLESYYEQIDSEQRWEEYMGKISGAFENMETTIESHSSDIMMKATTMDFEKLIHTGSFELPAHRNGKSNQDNIFISDPIEYEEEEDNSRWVTVTSNGLIYCDDEKKAQEEREEKEKQQKLKEEEARAKDENNKHNWTMTREERGLPKVQPKPQPVKPKVSKSKRRKNRRRGFKINKSKPSKM